MLLKYNFVTTQIISIKKSSMFGWGYHYFMELLEVMYIVNDKEYKQNINVSRKSPFYHLYCDSMKKFIDIKEYNFQIYVYKKFPKLIIENQDRLVINLVVGTISTLVGIILLIV